MVKSTKYSIKTLTRVVADIEKKLDDDFDFEVHNFDGIDKWFREDIKIGLSRIRSLILAVESIRLRRFLWVILSDTVRIVVIQGYQPINCILENLLKLRICQGM